MTCVKARFLFVTEASPINAQNTVLRIKQIQINDDDTSYIFPPHLQDPVLHVELMETKPAAAAKKILVMRGKFRNPTVSLKDGLEKIYLDDEGNPTFKDELLEEALGIDSGPIAQPNPSSTPIKKSLSSIMKDAVLEKFTARNSNASLWISKFESECARLGVPFDRHWEAIRLFLEGEESNWHSSAHISLKTTAWEPWRLSFLSAFAPKGWSEARYAHQFRFISGSLGEYARKKLSLLLNLDPQLPDKTQIWLIVVGLPIAVQERIQHDEIDSVSTLFTKINSLERAPRMYPSSPASSSSTLRSNAHASSKKFESCGYCAKKGFPGRMHSEIECRTKAFDLAHSSKKQSNINSFKSNHIPKEVIHSIELNDLIAEIDTKN